MATRIPSCRTSLPPTQMVPRKGPSSVSFDAPLVETMENRLLLTREMCRSRNPRAHQSLRALIRWCEKNNLPLEDALCRSISDTRNKSDLEDIIEHADPISLALIQRHLKDGWPVVGKVERSSDALRIHRGDGQHSWGFQRVGCAYYVGPFLRQERHGDDGLLCFSEFRCYRGQFAHNKREGFGEHYSNGPNGPRQVGRFRDDIFRGSESGTNDASNKPWMSRALSFFRR